MRSKINFFIIGPCALESMEQVLPLVRLAKKHQVPFFRANIFKPRTSPHSFQGLGKTGLTIINYLKSEGLKLVSEPCSTEHLEVVKEFATIIQIGARNMQNFEYLKSIGKQVDFSDPEKFVMLKRAFSCNETEWLSSAKYLEEYGVPRERIILCERGSRNFAAPYGVTLDLGLATKVKLENEYQVIIDPSHGTKNSDLVLPLTKGAMAMDFDGIMIETHPNPRESVSDAQQALHPDRLDKFLQEQKTKFDWTHDEETELSLIKESKGDRISTSSYN